MFRNLDRHHFLCSAPLSTRRRRRRRPAHLPSASTPPRLASSMGRPSLHAPPRAVAAAAEAPTSVAVRSGSDASGPHGPEALGLVVGIVYLVIAVISQQFHYAEDSIVSLVSVRFMILLGFVDDVLDVPCRVKPVLPTIAALPLLMAYNGECLQRKTRWKIGKSHDTDSIWLPVYSIWWHGGSLGGSNKLCPAVNVEAKKYAFHPFELRQLHGNVRMGIGALCQWELQCYQNYTDVRKRKRGIDDTEMPRGDATGASVSSGKMEKRILAPSSSSSKTIFARVFISVNHSKANRGNEAVPVPPLAVRKRGVLQRRAEGVLLASL
ncbi:hypothetical protein U9M48_015566 [Paspalum notatum var. saurae]|uniref:UDP-N-acetylglucosamine--dolichyl-phosphate N-acetylglucosaminephosphotransferase n=1 Tax=Paspalum notatum var. saurae TaxID=547442 RepID=A0AAQ3WLN4_PASNO